MDISPLQAQQGTPSIWDMKELPPGPPMPMDSPWVKSMQRFWPLENQEELSKQASNLLSNTNRMLSHQIAQETKRAKETARRWRDAISGR